MGQAVPTMVRLAAAVDAFPALALTDPGRERGCLGGLEVPARARIRPA